MSRMFRSGGSEGKSILDAELAKQRNAIRAVYDEHDSSRAGRMSIRDIEVALEGCGVDPSKKQYAEVVARMDPRGNGYIEFDDFFQKMTGDNPIQKALSGKLAIPNFKEFCDQLVDMFEETREVKDGKPADYIPQLANQDPEWYGMALCTVDGQVFKYGDHSKCFSIQSCSKPFSYCLAVEEHGPDEVHKFVGTEPSGVAFNAFTLSTENKPHNPMINAGAITVCSLIQPQLAAAGRFAYVLKRFSELAGGAKLGFSQPVYLSEKDTADRNFALAYYMRGAGVFSEGARLTDVLEFYFQCCSIEVNCAHLSVMAATLANAGVCPLTDVRCISPVTVKNCLQLMYSCGMYDYSGEWSCTVGLPSKSGVAGALVVVIPNVMGMCIWSPPLDFRGNSCRGMALCKKLVDTFNFSIFDQLIMVDNEDNHMKRPAEAQDEPENANGNGRTESREGSPVTNPPKRVRS